MSGKSLFQKIWDDHIVVPETADTPAVLYIDLHLTHEVTSPQAFSVLRSKGLRIRRPDLTLATLDHSTPTVPVPTSLPSGPSSSNVLALVAGSMMTSL